MIDAAPGEIARATDLQHALSIRAPLAWQVFRLARSTSALGCVSYAPLPDAMAGVFEAARRARWPKAEVEGAERAYLAFEEFVKRHAGDRGTFDGMVSGLAGGSNEQVEVKARRAAYRASAQLWGMQSAVTYRCLIASVTTEGAPSISAIIQGTRGARALRPGRSLPICRRTITMTMADESIPEITPEPKGTGLLEDFCSANLSRVTTKRRGSVAHDFIELSGVGLTAETDVFLFTKFGMGLDDTEPTIGLTSMIRVPTECFIADLLVPAGSMDPETAAVRVCGCLEDVSAAENAEPEYVLPSSHRAVHLGRSLDALLCKELPRCPELLRFVLRDLGRSREEFDLIRCRVMYPTLHTCVGLDVRRNR